MEENEKKQEQETQQGGYQPNFRPQAGRSPRPRINQPRPYANTGAGNQYKSNQQGEEEGFRPEGFGAALQGGTQQPRSSYRPRNSYNNQEGGYQRPQGGYQQRPQGGYGSQNGYGRSQGQGG